MKILRRGKVRVRTIRQKIWVNSSLLFRRQIVGLKNNQFRSCQYKNMYILQYNRYLDNEWRDDVWFWWWVYVWDMVSMSDFYTFLENTILNFISCSKKYIKKDQLKHDTGINLILGQKSHWTNLQSFQCIIPEIWSMNS